MARYSVWGVVLYLGLALAQPSYSSGSWARVGESTHFRYYQLAEYLNTPKALSNTQISIALLRLEVFWEMVAPNWGYPEGKINYYKFDSPTDLARLTGRTLSDKTISRAGMVFSLYASDPHELAHILTRPGGTAPIPEFWLEGLARYYTWPWMYCPEDDCSCTYQTQLGAWNFRSVHYWAQQDLRAGHLPELKTLIFGDTAFDQLASAEAFPVAGSFVAFLLGQNNPAKLGQFKAFLQRLGQTKSQLEVLRAFEQSFGLTLDNAEVAWKGFLSAWDEGSLK